MLERTQIGHLRQEVYPFPRKSLLLAEKAEEEITRCMLVGRVKVYQTNTFTKHATGRKGMQDINSPLEPCHELAIVSSKVTESLRLPLKDVNDGVGGFAIVKLVDYLMLKQVGPCSLLELIQGSFKEYFELYGGIN
jgi:hypothetical protein